MADIIELIQADHRRIRRVQQALRAAARTAGGEPGWVLPHTWDRLASLIEIHILTEEEICWLPMSGTVLECRAQIRDVAMTDAGIRDAIAETRLAPAGTPCWWRAVNDALAGFAARLDCVEKEILPHFARHADQRLRSRLGGQWLAFQAVCGRDHS